MMRGLLSRMRGWAAVGTPAGCCQIFRVPLVPWLLCTRRSGDHDTAFTLLFRVVDAREDWFPFIKADPDFDALHADHRWNELLQRMGLGNN